MIYRSRERWPFAASQDGLWTQVVLLQTKFAHKGIHFTPHANYANLIPGRKLEADVAIPELKLAMEYQGGDFMAGKSGHTNVRGLARDRFKCNECQLLGWIFLQFGPIETQTGEAMNTIERAIQMRIVLNSANEGENH